ncbi:hypothetical protein V3C99_015480 [Haemonchus contortus]
MDKVIYDFYSNLFDSHVYLPTHHLGKTNISFLRIGHAITSIKNFTVPGPDRIKPGHLKSLPPLIVRTLVRLFTRHLSESKVPTSWKTNKTMLLYKKGDSDNIDNIGQSSVQLIISTLLQGMQDYKMHRKSTKCRYV